MKVIAVLQARAGSSRLPGKVLKPILGKPMLERQLERVRRATSLDCIVVATSTERADDAIEQLCRAIEVPVFRGSLDDVLDRFYNAAAPYAAEHVVRLTGDCPLADPEVIDAVVSMHVTHGYDYTSNVEPPTFPDGLDAEIVRFAALEQAWREAKLPSEREHVTPFIRGNRERFRHGNLVNPRGDLSALRWTVDEPADFEFVTRVYEALHPARPEFGIDDILLLLARAPELAGLNSRFLRNEGYLKSLVKDAALSRDQG